MNISQNGINLIKEFEGCRLEAYLDQVGVWTIGFGHTKGVYQGQRITQQQAEDMLRSELIGYENAVRESVKVPLNQNQFDALTSFTYNCGISALKTSTLLEKLNAGDYIGAANELPRWNKGGGQVLTGLVRRRQAEKDLFLSGGSVVGPTKRKATIASHATQYATGETIPSWVRGQTYDIIQVEPTTQSISKEKVLLSPIMSWVLSQDIVGGFGSDKVGKPVAQQRTYTVKSGDNLWDISVKLYGDGTKNTQLKSLNGLAGDVIQPGQVLIY